MKNNANLIKALSDCIPCLRDNPEFTHELRQAARVLMEHGVNYVCNRYLMDDMNATWSEEERNRERTYLFISVGRGGTRFVANRVKANLSKANKMFDGEFEAGHYLTLEMYADADEPENLCASMSIEEHVD